MEMGIVILNLFNAMCWAGMATIVVYMFVDGIIMQTKKNKALREARDAGHEVVARLIDFKYEAGNEGRSYVWGYYEYEYMNRKYKYRQRYLNLPKDEVILYFKKRPEKAKEEMEFGGAESGYGTFFLIVTGVIFISRFLG